MKIRNGLLLGILLVCIMSCSQTNNPTSRLSTADNNTTLDKSGNRLGFKNLHLGMSREEFSEKSKSVDFPWEYELKEKYIRYKMKDNWIGCIGEKEYRVCYNFEPSLNVKWHDNKLVGISIMSLNVTADRINSYIKPWMKFALEILSEKYGSPTKVLFPVERMDISLFESHRVTYYYKWEKGNERITLGAGEGNSIYFCDISLEDVKGMGALEKAKKSNIKSEF